MFALRREVELYVFDLKYIFVALSKKHFKLRIFFSSCIFFLFSFVNHLQIKINITYLNRCNIHDNHVTSNEVLQTIAIFQLF